MNVQVRLSKEEFEKLVMEHIHGARKLPEVPQGGAFEVTAQADGTVCVSLDYGTQYGE